MTEKEFLRSYMIHVYQQGYPEYIEHPLFEERFELFTNSFLEEHHKEYFEVKFIKKNPEDIREEHKCRCPICDYE